jgi:hypothetical protein
MGLGMASFSDRTCLEAFVEEELVCCDAKQLRRLRRGKKNYYSVKTAYM